MRLSGVQTSPVGCEGREMGAGLFFFLLAAATKLLLPYESCFISGTTEKRAIGKSCRQACPDQMTFGLSAHL